MLRTPLKDFQKQLSSDREVAIQIIESKSGLALPDNHPINMIVNGVSLYEFFMQENRPAAAAYVESEYGACKEKKIMPEIGCIEQAKKDLSSENRGAQLNGVFHLAYLGEYNYLEPIIQTASSVFITAIAEGAAIAGHIEVVFALLENLENKENRASPSKRMVEGVFYSAARGGQGTLLSKLMKKYKGYEDTIIDGFIKSGFLREESSPYYSQLVSVLYLMEEEGLSIMGEMQTSHLLSPLVKDHFKILELPPHLPRVGFLSAKILMKLPDEIKRIKSVASELQEIFPRDLLEIILQYDFDVLQKDSDHFTAQSSIMEEKNNFAALPKIEQDRISTVVIRQLLYKTISRNTVLNASIAALYNSNKVNVLWVLIFPVWIYNNWSVTKTFFQLIQEKQDTSRHEIAKDYIAKFPHHLFSKKLQESFGRASRSDLSQQSSRSVISSKL